MSLVASILLYTVVWGSSMTDKDTRWLDKLVIKAGSGLGRRFDSLGTVVERWSKV